MKALVSALGVFSASSSLWGVPTGVTSASAQSPTPTWVKDLIVYEIATKGFTSPHGPQSGTFESLRARLPYLQDLGITGIWLTGHSLASAHHFYNVWNQYAVIEPDQLDPSFGTPNQFRALIDEAHRRGIKVFLDVITHGVMPESSLIKRHPDWFRGGSWGMVDYDWSGGHTDLDDWWVQMWTSYVTRFGVDGFRLDVDIYRPDLWSRIRQNAVRAGHPIAIFNEDKPVIPGVTDFTEAENMVSARTEDRLFEPFTDDIPKLYQRRFTLSGDYRVVIRYADRTILETSTRSIDSKRVELDGFTTNRISRQLARPAGQSELHLIVNGSSLSTVESIVVTRLDDGAPGEPKRWTYGLEDGAPLKVEGSVPVLDLYLSSFHGYSSSILLSCHDNGWMGFPRDKNPYAAEGSRAIFGYSFVFTPMIPIFMSGEGFDADFHPAPMLSPDLYGGKDPGKGRWLYWAQLDWSEVEQPRHRAMLEDVRKMLSIRRQERAVLETEVRGEVEPRLVAVLDQSDIPVPVPYMRWSEHTAIVISANRDSERDANLKLNIPIEKLGKPSSGRFKVTDLWNDKELGLYSEEQLAHLPLKVKHDKAARGGLAVIKIEAVN